MQKAECFNCNSSSSVAKQNILFLGDSLTKRCDLEKCYKDFACENRGLSGDTLSRFVGSGDRPWSSSNQAIVFLMGINDVIFLNATAQTLGGLYDTLFARIRADLPDIPIIVQSMYPVSISFEESLRLPDGVNSTIVEINSTLKSLCEKYGLRYVDVHSALLKNGELNLDYAADKIHVNEECYKAVSALIISALKEENL